MKFRRVAEYTGPEFDLGLSSLLLDVPLQESSGKGRRDGYGSSIMHGVSVWYFVLDASVSDESSVNAQAGRRSDCGWTEEMCDDQSRGRSLQKPVTERPSALRPDSYRKD